MLRAGIADVSGIANIADIADIGTDIADIATGIADVVNSADIADRMLRTLRWKQVDAYKVSRGCPVTQWGRRSSRWSLKVIESRSKEIRSKGILCLLLVISRSCGLNWSI